jgi:hypothetical protein
MAWWTWPLLAWCVLLAVSAAEMRGPVAVVGEAVVLVATVFAAVWHAEVVAHRVGEPFGTLVLALAVTVIEVLIVFVASGERAPPAASHHSQSAQPSRYTVKPSVTITMATSIRRSTGLCDDRTFPPFAKENCPKHSR